MAYVNNPQDIYQEKINPKNLDELNGAKNLRQVDDQVRLLNVPGVVEGENGEFLDFFKEAYRQFNWTENTRTEQEERPQAKISDEVLKKMAQNLWKWDCVELQADKGQELNQLIELCTSADSKRILHAEDEKDEHVKNL